MGDIYYNEKDEPITFEKMLSNVKRQVLKKVEKLITEEINIAHSENQPTSRLTSLYMKISNIKEKI